VAELTGLRTNALLLLLFTRVGLGGEGRMRRSTTISLKFMGEPWESFYISKLQNLDELNNFL
jgi:hypothetical protein